MTSRLKIFVAEDCPGCAEARAVATHIEQGYPQLEVEIKDDSLIGIGRKRIDILDPAGLELIAAE